jgi:uncharacterized protein
MRHLCDSNVFVSLVMSGHQHHTVIREWFGELPMGDTAVFCRMTQNSFLRLLTTDEFMRPYTLSNAKATSTYRALVKDVRFEFAAEPPGLEENWLSSGSVSRTSPKLWMDAYLASFAELTGMRFVTFDKAFRQFTKLDLLVLGH